MRAPILCVDDLRVERNGTRILDGVSWRIERGQHWVILGANGSGKTSLLKALTGYLMPTAGAISVLGETYGESDWRELRRHVGIVSSALDQMIDESETALGVVVSGKYAMINFWGKMRAEDRAAARRILRNIEVENVA